MILSRKVAPLTATAACFLLAVSYASTATGGGMDVDLQRQIVWHHERPSEPVFIPETVFSERELSEVPLTREQRETLEKILDQHRNPERYYHPVHVSRGAPFCMENLFSLGQGGHEDAAPLPDLVEESPIAFIGQVTEVVSGKDDLTYGVGRLVYLEVKEIVRANEKAKAPSPQVGDLVAVLKEGGTMEIAGVSLCEKIPKDFHQPAIGDWLLVLDHSPRSGSILIRNAMTFPVQGEQVMPQPYYRLKKGEGAHELRSLVREPRPRVNGGS